jgi:hypothetical protein
MEICVNFFGIFGGKLERSTRLFAVPPERTRSSTYTSPFSSPIAQPRKVIAYVLNPPLVQETYLAISAGIEPVQVPASIDICSIEHYSDMP